MLAKTDPAIEIGKNIASQSRATEIDALVRSENIKTEIMRAKFSADRHRQHSLGAAQ